jgi:multiple sugar transport system ATP-binding protein
MANIRLENITKRFGTFEAVKEMNLEVKDKEFVVFLGPSGCGKTTTLRLIAGLEQADEGSIFIDDVRVNNLSPSDRDIAFVFQFYALYPHKTVYDNIAFPLKAVKMPKSDIDVRVKEVANILHIGHLLDRKPNKLSGGEMQRVALGRAMVREPKVFLMDEPLTNLDASLRIEMRAELKRLQNDLGATTVYVTHDQVEAMAMGDRIAVMNRGMLQQIGAPMEIYNNPANIFVATFIGEPSMNLLNCQILQMNGKAFLKILHTDIFLEISDEWKKRIEDNVSDNNLILGIRPEDVFVYEEPKSESVETEVHVTEPLGSENIIDLSIRKNPEDGGNIILKVRTSPTFMVNVGQKLWMNFDLARIHIFDPKTEKAIQLFLSKRKSCCSPTF